MNCNLRVPDDLDETAGVIVMGMTANSRPEDLVVPVQQEINDRVSIAAASTVDENTMGLIFMPLCDNDAIGIS
jgi:hypothetical protein